MKKKRGGANEVHEGGIVAQSLAASEGLVNIRLDGATEYDIVEAFGKVLNTVSGVKETKIYSM